MSELPDTYYVTEEIAENIRAARDLYRKLRNRRRIRNALIFITIASSLLSITTGFEELWLITVVSANASIWLRSAWKKL